MKASIKEGLVKEVSMKVLVIAAHPDDEVLGCGGTIANHVANKDEVFVMILGDGVASRFTGQGAQQNTSLKIRRQEAKKAADFLGVKQVFLLDFPDNRFDTIPLLDIVKNIEQVKHEINPDIIYTHHSGDLNIDHQITFDAVLTAFRPLPGSSVRRILSFYVNSSTEWHYSGAVSFHPNVFSDISRTLPQKIAAMEYYKSELCPYPHPRSLKAIEYSMRYWGSCAGFVAAEPFMLVRERLL